MAELGKKGIRAQSQVHLPIYYKGEKLNKNYIVDILVENEVIIELKCVEELHPIHEVQLVPYHEVIKEETWLLDEF